MSGHSHWDQIDKLRMIHRQTSYDSVVLTKDTGIIQGLPIEGDQRKPEKTLTK